MPGEKDSGFNAPWGQARCRIKFKPDHERLGFPPLKCRTLADMTKKEIRAIEREYGAKVLPR